MANNSNNTPEQGTPKQGKQPTPNILELAARKQAAFSRGIYQMSGYKTFTTFYADLTIAEAFGPDAVRETCARITKEWAGNYKYFTEFVLCCNHKIWEWYEHNEPLARVFDECWRAADAIAAKWTGEAAQHYFDVTD